MDEDFTHISIWEKYERITQHDGVRTTICRNRFEIVVQPTGDISEQQVVQALREWVRWRKENEV